MENVIYAYPTPSLGSAQEAAAEPVRALNGVSLEVGRGEYVAIVGHNGSGKSTLARHLNGLLAPTTGDVWVKGWNTRDIRHLREIRATVGMVFQSPDNQIVATIVEEDVAFGPENLGVAHSEMVERVDWALEQVNLQPYRLAAPHLLSGGQKQRVCIAGVLAMRPEVLVLDEATAMLDPLGRSEVLEVAHRLRREQGTTVVAITHFMREAVDADRVIVMAGGQVVLEGTPRTVFGQVERLRALRLDVPQVTELARRLHARHPAFPVDVLSVGEMEGAILDFAAQMAPRSLNSGSTQTRIPIQNQPPEIQAGENRAILVSPTQPSTQPSIQNPKPKTPNYLISVKHLVHDYMQGTPLAVRALFDVSLEVGEGEIVGVIGHTGSGKSTAVQHLNGLLRAHAGEVWVLGQNLRGPGVDLRALRRQVGLVFQFAEAQLFERFVGDDVAYGPRAMGMGREEVRARVRAAMEAVGLGFEEFKDRVTFTLSGGERRRAALAGVLALEPRVLVLDEPTAGLDPEGRRQVMDLLLGLHARGTTLVMISHNMEELAPVCDRLYVIAEGRTVLEGAPGAIFGQAARLRELGLDVPAVTELVDRLRARGALPAGPTVYTLEQALEIMDS